MSKKSGKISLFFNHPKTLTVIGLFVIVAISIPLYQNIQKRYGISREVAQLNQEIKQLEGKNSKLNEMIKYLGSDQFVEEQARLNLNLKKEGESVAVIKGDENKITGNALPEAQSGSKTNDLIYSIPGLEKHNSSEETNNPKKWIAYFMD